MMAAYQPQPGAMHPGMAPHQHPGMTPGQPMTPAQMQQMGHPGGSGPGQPHVSQAGGMMGMQQGANGMGVPGGMGGQMAMLNQMGGQSMAGGMPNAQAFSQMTPMQQQHLMQQQQHIMNNPQAIMQQQQQMAMRRQMAQQQMMQQQQQQGGMHGMSQQQLQQMQQNNQSMQAQGVQLPPHLAQAQMAANAARQQQQQQQQQQQAQQAQNQHMQQLAMQQASSQQSNHGGQPTAPSQPSGQPQQPPQMRPQSRMANPNDPSQVQGQQTPQPGGPGQQQQQSAQGQHQNPQQGTPQQGQQQMTPQQQQQQQQAFLMRQRQIQHQQQQQQAQAHAQAQAQQQQRMAQSQHTQPAGLSILRLVHLCDELSQFDDVAGKDISQWHQIIDKHFAPEGRLVHRFDPKSGTGKTFEVPRPTIARYFQTYFESGADSVRIHADHPRETNMNNRLHVAYQSSTFAVGYPTGARLEMRGSMNFLFAAGTDAIECMEIKTTKFEEVIPRSKIEDLLSSWSPTMDTTSKSPKMTKKPPKSQQKAPSGLDGLTIEHFPKTPKGPMGAPKHVQQFLEIGETMNIMNDLVGFAGDSNLRPSQALEQLVRTYEQTNLQPHQQQPQHDGNPQINLPPNGMTPGSRTPSMANMSMPGGQQPNHFSSPALSNMSGPVMNGSPHIPHNPNLTAPHNMPPNSHTPSPHQSNMAAPPMLPQHSQQGTSSSAASANTSPNVGNKRRRSTVKMEGDEGSGEGGGAHGAGRVKPSPRLGKKNKPGGG
ncbi:uncharacterized protein LTR77_000161 [Saxophila tyrrhenica]|uniref:LIM-domain binding protein-domain-containing protein n=1 Tax=Saxophila tyrrhenica TaxID=1690608 RepID=A0AAV9PRQ6_9PEZI|nr:hypothetical protein LTR77_000161 [Saxophila tyrrhenica]